MRQSDKRPPRMNAAEAAHIVGLRHGRHDPSAVELRAKAKRDARAELAREVFTVALWFAGAYFWIMLTWGGE